jgi:hypothetical protein
LASHQLGRDLAQRALGVGDLGGDRADRARVHPPAGPHPLARLGERRLDAGGQVVAPTSSCAKPKRWRASPATPWCRGLRTTGRCRPTTAAASRTCCPAADAPKTPTPIGDFLTTAR